MNAILVWRATQWFVQVTVGDALVAEVPLEVFLELPAVKYVTELALERADLGLRPKAPQPA